jgi:hypothetical protein
VTVYRSQGVVVGLRQPSVAAADFGVPEEEWTRIPTGRIQIDVDLAGGGRVSGFPWGLADEPNLGDTVLMSIEVISGPR